MSERFGPAYVRSGDWHGTVALDDPDDPSELYRLVGIDPGDWIICGLEIENTSETEAAVVSSVVAVRSELINEPADWEKVARAHGGTIPTTRFVFGAGHTMAILAAFKRVEIRATLRHAAEGAAPDLEVVDTIYAPE
jgi:hypothetical protein